jgi:hypothetical protein
MITETKNRKERMTPTTKQRMVYLGGKVPFQLREDLRIYAIRKGEKQYAVVEKALNAYLKGRK